MKQTPAKFRLAFVQPLLILAIFLFLCSGGGASSAIDTFDKKINLVTSDNTVMFYAGSIIGINPGAVFELSKGEKVAGRIQVTWCDQYSSVATVINSYSGIDEGQTYTFREVSFRKTPVVIPAEDETPKTPVKIKPAPKTIAKDSEEEVVPQKTSKRRTSAQAQAPAVSSRTQGSSKSAKPSDKKEAAPEQGGINLKQDMTPEEEKKLDDRKKARLKRAGEDTE